MAVSFDDYGNPLDLGQPLEASASPGLDTLPPQGDVAPSIGPATTGDASQLEEPNPQAISPGFAPKSAPPPAASMTGFQSSRNADDQQYLESLPTTQKIGLMLQSFSSGMAGGPNPIDAMLQQRRQQRLDAQTELASGLNNLKTAYDLLDRTPDGPQKDALREMLSRKMPGLAGAFDAHGADDETRWKSVLSNMTPSAQDYVTKTCGVYPSQSKRMECFKTVALDKEGSAKIESLADQDNLPNALAKIKALVQTAQGTNDPRFVKDGKFAFSEGDVLQWNAQLVKDGNPNALTPSELQTFRRQQAAFIPYGLTTDKTAQAQQETAAKQGPQSQYAKIQADVTAGRITPEQGRQAMKALDNKVVIQNQTIDKNTAESAARTDVKLTPQAVSDAADRYRIDGTLPPSLGRGVQGQANTAMILNAAADKARADGDSGEEARIRQLAGKAGGSALTKLTQAEATTGAFEKNAIKNADIALANSAKVDRTGVPALNRWILAGQKDIAGDVAVHNFHQANETFINEYAKIMSGSMGNTAVSDSLRKETATMLATKDTPEQYASTVAQMKLEMRNRMQGFGEQKAEVSQAMRTPRGTAAAATAPTQAATVASGSYPTATGPGGKKVIFKDGKWQPM